LHFQNLWVTNFQFDLIIVISPTKNQFLRHKIMAILGEIRKQTWLLIVVIGIAMVAFLAGDLFSENSVVKRLFTGDPNEVGNVNGESITLAEFINAQSNMGSNQNLSQNQISQQVWNELVSQKI